MGLGEGGGTVFDVELEDFGLASELGEKSFFQS